MEIRFDPVRRVHTIIQHNPTNHSPDGSRNTITPHRIVNSPHSRAVIHRHHSPNSRDPQHFSYSGNGRIHDDLHGGIPYLIGTSRDDDNTAAGSKRFITTRGDPPPPPVGAAATTTSVITIYYTLDHGRVKHSQPLQNEKATASVGAAAANKKHSPSPYRMPGNSTTAEHLGDTHVAAPPPLTSSIQKTYHQYQQHPMRRSSSPATAIIRGGGVVRPSLSPSPLRLSTTPQRRERTADTTPSRSNNSNNNRNRGRSDSKSKAIALQQFKHIEAQLLLEQQWRLEEKEGHEQQKKYSNNVDDGEEEEEEEKKRQEVNDDDGGDCNGGEEQQRGLASPLSSTAAILEKAIAQKIASARLHLGIYLPTTIDHEDDDDGDDEAKRRRKMTNNKKNNEHSRKKPQPWVPAAPWVPVLDGLNSDDDVDDAKDKGEWEKEEVQLEKDDGQNSKKIREKERYAVNMDCQPPPDSSSAQQAETGHSVEGCGTINENNVPVEEKAKVQADSIQFNSGERARKASAQYLIPGTLGNGSVPFPREVADDALVVVPSVGGQLIRGRSHRRAPTSMIALEALRKNLKRGAETFLLQTDRGAMAVYFRLWMSNANTKKELRKRDFQLRRAAEAFLGQTERGTRLTYFKLWQSIIEKKRQEKLRTKHQCRAADTMMRATERGMLKIFYLKWWAWSFTKKWSKQSLSIGIQVTPETTHASTSTKGLPTTTSSAGGTRPTSSGGSLKKSRIQVDWDILRRKLPTDRTQAHKTLRMKLFKQFDVHNRGYFSLPEANRGVREVLCVPEALAAKPVVPAAFNRARTADQLQTTEKYGGKVQQGIATPSATTSTTNATTKVEPHQSSQTPVTTEEKQDKSLYVERCEFRMFLVFLRQYLELYVMFDSVDESGDGVICVDEFAQAIPLLEGYGVPISVSETPQIVFDTIDVDKGGSITFEEFSDWALNRGADLSDDDDFDDELLHGVLKKRK